MSGTDDTAVGLWKILEGRAIVLFNKILLNIMVQTYTIISQ